MKWIQVMFFISTLIAAFVFVTIAGNFLLLRVYTDLEGQQRQFRNLLRIGFPFRHLQRSVTIQIAWLFFLPVILAVALTACALYYGLRCAERLFADMSGPEEMATQALDLMTSSVLFATSAVGAVFIALQVSLFLVARAWTLRAMKRQMALSSSSS